MNSQSQRLEILRRVENGELSLLEANRLLFALDQAGAAAEQISEPDWQSAGPEPDGPGLAAVQAVQPVAPAALVQVDSLARQSFSSAEEFENSTGAEGESLPPAESEAQTRPMNGWRSLWLVVFVIGLFLTLVSTNWMVLGVTTAGLSWGFWLSFFPFALGVLGMWSGWELRRARWLHVRIRQSPGQRPTRIAFGIPLPIGLTRWAVQRFGKFIPLQRQGMVDFFDQVDQATMLEGPMHIYVEDKDGARVEIWIEGPG